MRASRGGQLQQRIQRHHGHELVAHNHSLALGHRQQGAARQTHQLGDVLGREAERLPLHLYQQHAQHGQRQRQAQAEAGAHAVARVDADVALQLVEHGLLDHIHAHAPPRQVGDHAAGGKAGQKNQINRFLVAQGGGFVGTEQAFFHGFVAHGLQRNAPRHRLTARSICAAILACRQLHAALGRLACSTAHVGGSMPWPTALRIR